MTKVKKLFDKFVENPTSLRYSQIEKVLLYLEFEKIQTKGSHVKFKHFMLDHDLVIPVHNRDCKDFYKN